MKSQAMFQHRNIFLKTQTTKSTQPLDYFYSVRGRGKRGNKRVYFFKSFNYIHIIWSVCQRTLQILKCSVTMKGYYHFCWTKDDASFKMLPQRICSSVPWVKAQCFFLFVFFSYQYGQEGCTTVLGSSQHEKGALQTESTVCRLCPIMTVNSTTGPLKLS